MVSIKFNKKLNNEYDYFESNKKYYFIVNQHTIIDEQKNILICSNINLENKTILDKTQKYVSDIDLTKAECDVYENIIYIQHWFNTYGHFKDELFNLYNFYELFDKKHLTALMSYKKPNHIGYDFDNYDVLSKLLFEKNNFINASESNKNIIQINNLVLIKHNFHSQMFHMFPSKAINKILSKINFVNNNNFNKNVFITRGKALHLPRNLNNQKEIEEHFSSINYNVINPETMSIESFINSVKNAENVFITWGGSMVNLCYVNPNANIYLLQSLSYKDESIFAIFRFLRNYKNLYLIKCNDDNVLNVNCKNKIQLKYN